MGVKRTGAESGLRGVHATTNGKWKATISHHGERKALGTFSDLEEAKKARRDAEILLFGYCFDRREIELHEDHARVPLHGMNGNLRGWAEVDLDDVEKVKGVTWSFNGSGYAASSGADGLGLMHRWILFDGEKGHPEIDHKDGNRLNNRRSNLRECNRVENSQNHAIRADNTSGCPGVSKCKQTGRWAAYINTMGKRAFLGRFDTKEDARSAREKAKSEMHWFQPNQRNK